MREFTYVVEKDEDGLYVASVPSLPGCFTQAETTEELRERLKEAIELYLEEFPDMANGITTMVSVDRIAV
jgi:predicted RNase H-like HicB family nuclease